MSKKSPKSPRLGRGLSSMLNQPAAVDVPRETSGKIAAAAVESDAVVEELSGDASPAGGRVLLLPVGVLGPNPFQPRTHFDDASLNELAESLKVAGVMQPLVVRRKTSPNTSGDAKGTSGGAGKTSGGGVTHEIIAGERRWRAAQLAGMAEVPCLVHELDDAKAAEWALIENLQREDLNPFERANAFEQLAEKFQLSHQQIAERVGVQRSTVTNALRLLSLDPTIQKLVVDGSLSAGHARALAGLDDVNDQLRYAKQVIAKSMSVRQLEAALRSGQPIGSSSDKSETQNQNGKAGGSHLADLEQQISRQLGTKVRIKSGRRKGSGTLSIDFYTLDAFDALLDKLGVTTE